LAGKHKKSVSSSSDSVGQVAAKIDFPCLYPIKIIGKKGNNFQAEVVETIERHTCRIAEDMMSTQASRKKNYLSITVTISATGEDQLRRIFLDLDKIKNVKMVI
jgi:hypothetical protein